MRRTLLALMLATACALPAFAAPPKSLPDITLATAAGTTLTSADFKGKVVLLDFWASWCIPCRKSFPEVDRLSKELTAKGVVVVAVNVDEQRKNADAFLAAYPHSMTIGYDTHGTLAETFDLQAMPSSIIIDTTGRVRFTHMGYTDKTIGQFRSELLQLLAEAH